jgi:hypothetical protein
VDIASVAFFRICFGLLMLWHTLQYLAGGRLERQYLTPVFFFKFPGFEWMHPGSPAMMRALFAALAVLAVMIAAGLFYRAACALFLAGFLYVFLLDEADYQNHLYLIALLALVLLAVPAHRGFSLDALRRPRLRAETIPAWGLWLLRFQIAVPYVFGGLAKLNYDWLVRAQPMRLWLQEGTEGGLRLDFLKTEWGAYFLSWGGALYDLGVVPLLLWRRTRVPAFLVTVLFHLTNSELFTIGIFPWLMIAGALLFFPPDWPRRLRLFRTAPARRSAPVPLRTPAVSRAVVAALGLFVGLQVLLPFRHFLYPGPVDWTEEGHRFSWRMKLRDKRGEVRFVAVDPASGRSYPLHEVDAVLTQNQRLMMIHDPEMIRQFARFLKERLQQAGYPGVEVRALTSVSLNGRPRQSLVDPGVDLGSVPRTAGHAGWIVPLKE